MEEAVVAELELLEYDPVWMEWGYLSAEELQRQVAEYRLGEDPHTEHYRYDSFRQILAGRKAISEEEMEQYLSLTERDPDIGMAQAARVDLLLWRGLTPEQFERLSHDPRFAAPLFQKLARRRRLVTALEVCSAVSEALFAEILAAQDAQAQRILLDGYLLTPEQYTILAEQGVTRAIRNQATVRRREMLKAASRRSGLEVDKRHLGHDETISKVED